MILSIPAEVGQEIVAAAHVVQDEELAARIVSIRKPDRCRLSEDIYDRITFAAERTRNSALLEMFPTPGAGIAAGEDTLPGVHEAVLAGVSSTDARLILNLARTASFVLRSNLIDLGSPDAPPSLARIALGKILIQVNEAILKGEMEGAYRLMLFTLSDLLWFSPSNPDLDDPGVR